MPIPMPVAVLIDAENIRAELFAPLQGLVEAVGEATSWQAFGDFFSWPHPGWLDVAKANGIDIRHQFQGGKNSADIAMTIAAMDLMHAGKVRAICLASTDSDFTALARRLRAEGLLVHGFGEAAARQSFREACSTFTILIPPLAPPAARTGIDQLDIKRLHELLHCVCRERGNDGRVHLSVAAQYVKNTAPDLYPSISGGGFLKRLAGLDFVELHRTAGQHLVSIRRKPLAIVR
jgi:uncharacterized LabA/DUF88 family protein